MPARRLALLLAAALAAVPLAGCAELAGPALAVQERTVGHAEMLEEIQQWAANTAATGAPGPITGASAQSVPAEFAAQVVTFRIRRELVNAEAERRGVVVGEQQLQAARIRLYGDPATADAIEAGFSQRYARQLLGDVAREVALIEELGELEHQAWINEALATARIEVSSRFGAWDPRGQRVVPPRGPVDPLA